MRARPLSRIWAAMRVQRRSLAASFLTLSRVPLGGFPYQPEEYRAASRYFPLVGSVVGGAGALAFQVSLPLGEVGAALISVAVMTLCTGGLHEDGLADTADALFGSFDRDKLFSILKDSRLGSFGVLTLVLVLGFRVTMIASLDARAPTALLLSATLTRVAPVWLMSFLPYVTPRTNAKSSVVAAAGPLENAIATGLGVLVLGAGWRWGGISVHELLCICLGLPGLSLFLAWRFRVRAGGWTGDFLGATQQCAECLVLAALSWP
ncbi:MAG: adenosylcobinamide-GDP ribazoletransferase [Myxococcota bacterium]